MVSFKDAFLRCFIFKIFNFTDRAPRSEFWWFFLCYVPFFFVVAYINYKLTQNNRGNIVATLLCIYTLLILVAASARRLHDLDISAWWAFGVIPLATLPIYLYKFLFVGTIGSNEYGDDPLIAIHQKEIDAEIAERRRQNEAYVDKGALWGHEVGSKKKKQRKHKNK